MKISPIVGARLIILTVIGGWGVILFSSNSHPDLLPELVGCYRGPTTLVRRDVKISKLGEVSSENVKVVVSISLDKEGISFLPVEKIVINLTGNSGIEKRSGNPFLLRIADDYRSFSVPDENGPDIQFIRVSCENAQNQT